MISKIILIIILLMLITSGCGILKGFEKPFTGGPGAPPKSPTHQLWKTAQKSNWMVTMAIPIIALGAVAAFNGMAKLGMSAAIFGCVNLFLALATARFAIVMAVFGLIGSCAVVGASILMKNRAITETVVGVQKYSEAGITIDNAKLKDTLKDVHSKSTQRLIGSVKSKLKLKGIL